MKTRLPPGFSASLSSLNEAQVEYLLVGGCAAGFHGYARATGTIDVWARQSSENAARLVTALRAFGFDVPGLVPDLFLIDGRIVRMGLPPNRVEVMTSVSGLAFDQAWARRETSDWDGLAVPVIGLADFADLDELPPAPEA